jgi:hypothetical protein
MKELCLDIFISTVFLTRYIGWTMNKLLLWIVLGSSANIVFAQDFVKMVQCDTIVNESVIDFIEQKCYPLGNDKNYFACSKGMYDSGIETSCSPLMKSKMKMGSFMDSERLLIVSLRDEKKISKSEYAKKLQKIYEIQVQEIKNYRKFYDKMVQDYLANERSRISNLEVQARIMSEAPNYRSQISDLVSVLNGPWLIQANTPKVHNYNLNGRLVTCTTTSQITNCF